MKLFKELLERPSVIAFIPALAVIFDYTMTLTFSGGREAIIALEYSPVLKAAMAGNLFIPCLAALAIGYYSMGYLALQGLKKTRYYPFGVLLIILIGSTHITGGFSWIVRNSNFSRGVLLIAAAGIAIAVWTFVLALKNLRARTASAS
ncbi:MAG TPA: hypothetical protein VMS81_00330 [Methanomicrobiales archaeon]|nr:hypothetical protein [Methanomicrobiales archaeon]